jgi:predicted AlkP superfamily phosphohydrolase/phosphomutase
MLVSGVQFRARILLREWSRPKELGRSLVASNGRSREVNEIFGQPTRSYLLQLRRDLLAAPARLAEAAEQLLKDQTFDLVWVNFVAAHQAGHVLFDPSGVCESLSASDTRALRGALADVYGRVDEALGRIVALLPSGADILVISPKGMGANTSRVDLLPGMIDRILGQDSGGSGASQTNPAWFIRSCVPISLRARVAAALPDRVACALAGRLETLGRDWKRTRAFAPPCDNEGFVRFNLSGRERQGLVPRDQAPELSEQIAEGLLSFEDVGGDTPGAPSVRRVQKASDRVGRGEHWEDLPDLFVDWSQGPSTRIKGARSSRFGEVVRRGVGTGRSGTHCHGAFVTLIPGSARVADAIPQIARLEDIPATICSALGVPCKDLPGRALLTRS